MGEKRQPWDALVEDAKFSLQCDVGMSDPDPNDVVALYDHCQELETVREDYVNKISKTIQERDDGRARIPMLEGVLRNNAAHMAQQKRELDAAKQRIQALEAENQRLKEDKESFLRQIKGMAKGLR